MTKKYYDLDAYATEFDATVRSCTEEKKGYAVLLDGTLFFPVEGGQKADGGTLDGKTGVVKVAVLEGTTITLPKPAREGYEFDYWEGSRYDAGASYKVEGDHTFKAQWKKSESSANKPANDVKKSSNDNKSAPSSPKTGDNNKMAVYLILMAAALICPAAVLMLRRRRSR